jgi:flagellar biosynthetic protein FliR
MLNQLLPNDVFSLLLVFARIGSAVMLLPGFGEVFVPARARLGVALMLSLIVAPVVAQTLPALPADAVRMFLVVGGEIVVGLFIGAMARAMLSALHVAGVVIGFQTSLSNATFFDPANAQQGVLIAAFMNVIGVLLIFTANLHHLMLAGLVDSYSVFRPGDVMPLGDFSDAAVRVVGRSFDLGLQVAAPFVVVGLVFYVGLGLLSRLMPQIQVFFIAVPLQLVLGFLVMALTLSAAMLWFLDGFQTAIGGLLGRP